MLDALDTLELIWRRLAATVGADDPRPLLLGCCLAAERLEAAVQTQVPESVQRAVELLERSVDRLAAAQGERHPNVVMGRGNVALAKLEFARTVESVALLRQAVDELGGTAELASKVFGAAHRNTLIAVSNRASAQLVLATVASDEAARERAEDLLLHLARSAAETLGPQHPLAVVTAQELKFCRYMSRAGGYEAQRSGDLLLRAPAATPPSGFGGSYSTLQQAASAVQNPTQSRNDPGGRTGASSRRRSSPRRPT